MAVKFFIGQSQIMAVELLIGLTGELVIEPIIQEYLGGLIATEDQVEWINNELQWLQSLLEDKASSYKQEPSASDRQEWEASAWSIFQNVDLLFNLYISKFAQNKKKLFGMFNTLFYRCELGKMMEDIKNDIRIVAEECRRWKMKSFSFMRETSTSEEPQITHKAKAAIASIMVQSEDLASENLLDFGDLRRGAKDIRSMSIRLYGIIDCLEPDKLDERWKVWLQEIIEASDFAKKILEPRIEKRKQQPAEEYKDPPSVVQYLIKDPRLVVQYLKFSKDVGRIKVRIQNLFDWKWRYGIGDSEEEQEDSTLIAPMRKEYLNPTRLSENLWHQIKKKLALRQPLGDKLRSIKGDLRLMNALRKDTRGMENIDQRVKIWLDQMEVIALDHDAKDLDDYVEEAEDRRPGGDISCWPFTYFTEWKNRKKIWKKLKRIEKKIHDISNRKRTYDIGKIEGIRRSSHDAEDHSHGSAHVFNQQNTNVPRKTGDLEEQVESIRSELSLMDAFFEDVQSMGGKDKRLTIWVEQMKDIAGVARNLIDSYDSNTQQEGMNVFRRSLLNNAAQRKIEMIKNDIQGIYRKKITYVIGGIKRSTSRVTNVANQEAAAQSISAINETNSISNREETYPVGFLVKLAELIYPDIQNLQKNAELVKGDLSLMDALLEDVREVGTQDAKRRAWLKEMKGIHEYAKTVTEEYEKITSHLGMLPIRLRIARKMRLTVDKINDITERRMAYGIEHFKSSSSQTMPHSSVTGSPSIIGFYDDIQTILDQLLSKPEHDPVISIVGMEGIGKRTLAKLIYDNNAVKCYFHCVWECVPSDCNVKALGHRIEKQATQLQRQEGNKGMETETRKQVLIFLDNVRTTEIWDRLMTELPSTLQGSRIVLTTCDIGVATHANRKGVHKLQLLSDDDSWALFSKGLDIPEEQQKWSRKMVIKCGGLPRTIRQLKEQISGLGPTDNTWSNRENLEKSLFEKLDQSPWKKMLDVIKGLPLPLRNCVSYLTRFPAEFEIPLRRLIVLWIAEGLVLPRRIDEETPESVAGKYLQELIDRNLVQVTKRKLNGEVQKCRLPYALQEVWSLETSRIASSVSHTGESSNWSPETMTAGSSVSHTEESSNSSTIARNILYLTHDPAQTDAKSKHIPGVITGFPPPSSLDQKHVISFRSFETREESKVGAELGKLLDQCISSGYFLSMRVLDLERVFRPQLPKALGELVLLRYLGLRWTYLQSLPPFINKLLNLQTLDLKHTCISALPSSIWKMEQLRHLYVDEIYRCRFKPRPSKYSLKDLQTLWSVFIDEDSPLTNGLDRLTNLKRLGVLCRLMSSRKEAMLPQLKEVASWVQKIDQLESLRLKSFDKEGRPWQLPKMDLSHLTELSSLYLLGKIEEDFLKSKLPRGVLTELTLSGSGLEEDPMQALKVLPNLRILRLFSGSFTGRKMLCSFRDFPKLQILKLWKLEQLEEWEVENGAFPALRDLEIRSCTKLKMLPDGFQRVKTLQKLKLSAMPSDFTDRIEINQGEDRVKIAHVRYVYINNKLVDHDEIWEKLSKSTLDENQKIFLSMLALEKLPEIPILAAELSTGSIKCPFCGTERESAAHLFFLCPPIKLIWFSKCGIRTEYFSNLSISDWINLILTPTLIFGGSPPSETVFLHFAVTLMQTIWSWRNKVITGDAEFDPDRIYEEARSSSFGERD